MQLFLVTVMLLLLALSVEQGRWTNKLKESLQINLAQALYALVLKGHYIIMAGIKIITG